MEEICDAIFRVLKNDHPASCRSVFYQMIGTGLIEKTEREYKGTIIRLLKAMREEERIPYDWISDGTRWRRKPRSHRSLQDALKATQRDYRRALWQDQEVYVEVWCEKEALSDTLYEVTEEWDVPLLVTRGYASITFIYNSAQQIRAQGKPAHIYYFGDHDPSGLDISRKLEEGLRRYSKGFPITFERAGVTPEQIQRWNLPSRPTKSGDTRGKNFKGRSTEVDSIQPQRLRELVGDCITRHIDDEVLDRHYMIEAAEQLSLDQLVIRRHPDDGEGK